MTQTFKAGDKVRWNSHGSTAVGTVERKITSDTEAAGRTVLWEGAQDIVFEAA